VSDPIAEVVNNPISYALGGAAFGIGWVMRAFIVPPPSEETFPPRDVRFREYASTRCVECENTIPPFGRLTCDHCLEATYANIKIGQYIVRMPFRRFSISKRVGARTSWKRYARHNMGLKAPRGGGWFTNPKRAAYNRVYHRTSFDLVGAIARFFRR